jgi:hypothetical protein
MGLVVQEEPWEQPKLSASAVAPSACDHRPNQIHLNCRRHQLKDALEARV